MKDNCSICNFFWLEQGNKLVLANVYDHLKKNGSVNVWNQSIWKNLYGSCFPPSRYVEKGMRDFVTEIHVPLSTVGLDRCIPPAAHAEHSFPGCAFGSSKTTEWPFNASLYAAVTPTTPPPIMIHCFLSVLMDLLWLNGVSSCVGKLDSSCFTAW